MKFATIIGLLLISLTAIAQPQKCDLSENDSAVDAVNTRMDNAQMRGEDHVIELMRLHRERMVLIEDCMNNDTTGELTKTDLTELKTYINDGLDVRVAELNESIRYQISYDRIGMATELTMERDILILETKNLLAKVDDLIRLLSKA